MDAAKNSAEAANQTIARAWWADIDLTFDGADLGDCIAYDVLSTLGRAWLNDATAAAQPKPNDQPNA